MIVYKRCSFDAAHYLPGYKGKCSQMHGHRWVVEIGLGGQVYPSTGMVVDFSYMKDVLKKCVVDVFDHKLVNNIIDNPTAENIALYIQRKINEEWIQGPGEEVRLKVVRVWETEDSYAEISG